MKKLLLLPGGLDFRMDDVKYIQDAFKEALVQFFKSDVMNAPSPSIIWGCVVTNANNNASVSEGCIYFNNEIYLVEQHQIIGSGTLYWKLDVQESGQVLFEDGNTKNIYQDTKLRMTYNQLQSEFPNSLLTRYYNPLFQAVFKDQINEFEQLNIFTSIRLKNSLILPEVLFQQNVTQYPVDSGFSFENINSGVIDLQNTDIDIILPGSIYELVSNPNWNNLAAIIGGNQPSFDKVSFSLSSNMSSPFVINGLNNINGTHIFTQPYRYVLFESQRSIDGFSQDFEEIYNNNPQDYPFYLTYSIKNTQKILKRRDLLKLTL